MFCCKASQALALFSIRHNRARRVSVLLCVRSCCRFIARSWKPTATAHIAIPDIEGIATGLLCQHSTVAVLKFGGSCHAKKLPGPFLSQWQHVLHHCVCLKPSNHLASLESLASPPGAQSRYRYSKKQSVVAHQNIQTDDISRVANAVEPLMHVPKRSTLLSPRPKR